MFALNVVFKLFKLDAAKRAKRLFAPAPKGHRNDSIDCGVPAGHLDKIFFDHPVKNNIGARAPRIGDGG